MNSTEFRLHYNDPTMRDKLAEANKAHVKRCIEKLRAADHAPVPELTALEIGCYEGGMTRFMLENGIAGMFCVDPFTGSPEHGELDKAGLRDRFDKNIAPYSYRIYVIPEPSGMALWRMIVCQRMFNLIYIDGSHDSRDVIFDAVLSWQLLKPGGIMIFDDFLWAYHDQEYRNPKPAIDFFVKAFAPNLSIIESHYQLSVQKI